MKFKMEEMLKYGGIISLAGGLGLGSGLYVGSLNGERYGRQTQKFEILDRLDNDSYDVRENAKYAASAEEQAVILKRAACLESVIDDLKDQWNIETPKAK